LRNPSKKSKNHGNLIGQVFFQNDVLKFQEEYAFGTDLEVSRHFLFYIFETNQRCSKDSKNNFAI
jgi:hypothetical protein